MKLPINRMTKQELVWMNAHKCKHGHTYLEHYSCYMKENPNNGRIGFFDIEVTDLKANNGLLLCYCIKDMDSDKIYEGAAKFKKGVYDNIDRAVVKKCVKDLKRFDRIVTYFGTGFDIPYIRSKAVHYDIDFPIHGELCHTDLYYIIRNKFKLSRSSLAVATEYLLGSTNKTRLDFQLWKKAGLGCKESMNYILEHCRMDVVDTQRLYEKVIGYKRETKLSI